MGKGGWTHPEHVGLKELTWDEVRKHSEQSDQRVVVDDYVYDVSTWAKRHPGERRSFPDLEGAMQR